MFSGRFVAPIWTAQKCLIAHEKIQDLYQCVFVFYQHFPLNEIFGMDKIFRKYLSSLEAFWFGKFLDTC
jgi:hypothetical protein